MRETPPPEPGKAAGKPGAPAGFRLANGRPKLRLPSAAQLVSLLEGLRLPRIRDRRAAPAILALAAVGAGVVIGAYLLAARLPPKTSFPRDAKGTSASLLDERLKTVGEELEADPEDLEALVEAGTVHFLKGPQYYRNAMNYLEEARDLGALDPRIFYYLGVMYQEEGLLPYAIQEYRKFVRNVPEDREVRLLLGKLLYQTGRYEDAAVQYQSLKAASGTTDPVIEENLGLSLLALKRYDEAADSFRKLLGQPAFEARAQFYLGQLSSDRGQYAGAQERFRAAAAALERGDGVSGLEPVAAWAAIAANDEKVEDWPAAKGHWEKVLALDPKSSTAKTALNRVNAKLRSAQRARGQKEAAGKAAAKKAEAKSKARKR